MVRPTVSQSSLHCSKSAQILDFPAKLVLATTALRQHPHKGTRIVGGSAQSEAEPACVPEMIWEREKRRNNPIAILWCGRAHGCKSIIPRLRSHFHCEWVDAVWHRVCKFRPGVGIRFFSYIPRPAQRDKLEEMWELNPGHLSLFIHLHKTVKGPINNFSSDLIAAEGATDVSGFQTATPVKCERCGAIESTHSQDNTSEENQWFGCDVR